MNNLSSMTGFARIEGHGDGFSWSWELKSVNGRALDLRFRLPSGSDALEQTLKHRAGEKLRRGSVSATLTVTETTRPPSLRLNEAALDQIMAQMARLGSRMTLDPPRLDGLLALPGVIEIEKPARDEAEQERRDRAIVDGFGLALDQLSDARQAEGRRLAAILHERLAEIDGLIAAAEAAAALQPAAMRLRFAVQLSKLTTGALPVGEDRLAQELALLVQKADVREELDRLTAHVAAARGLLGEAVAVGRKLDFLCQEFNRETNTIGSKSADLGLTRIGLDLKAVVEQFREQVQNVE